MGAAKLLEVLPVLGFDKFAPTLQLIDFAFERNYLMAVVDLAIPRPLLELFVILDEAEGLVLCLATS